MFFLTLSLALYVAPALLASSRHHPRASAIALTNLFFGWTLVGWIACLVWALAEPPRPFTPAYPMSATVLRHTEYPAGWSAASQTEPRCRACTRPLLPSSTFCTMCGANQVLRQP